MCRWYECGHPAQPGAGQLCLSAESFQELGGIATIALSMTPASICLVGDSAVCPTRPFDLEPQQGFFLFCTVTILLAAQEVTP